MDLSTKRKFNKHLIPALVLFTGIVSVIFSLWLRKEKTVKGLENSDPKLSQTVGNSSREKAKFNAYEVTHGKDGKRSYPFRSPSEFAKWLRTDGGYEVYRIQGYVRVQISPEAFRKLGLGDREIDGFYSASDALVNRFTTAHGEYRQTGNITIGDFQLKNPLPDNIITDFYRESIQADGGSKKQIDPIVVEGILECLKAEPYCYYLHQHRIRTTLEDTVKNGIPVFKVTEEMVGKSGEVINVRSFVWSEKGIPPPYSNMLRLEQHE